MKIALYTLASLIFLFAISLKMSLKQVAVGQVNLKNGSKGLAFGLGTLILLCLLQLASVAQGYAGRCYQFWNDDFGTPCSRLEHFSINADFVIGIYLLAGWPFILIFLGICALVACIWPKLSEKLGT